MARWPRILVQLTCSRRPFPAPFAPKPHLSPAQHGQLVTAPAAHQIAAPCVRQINPGRHARGNIRKGRIRLRPQLTLGEGQNTAQSGHLARSFPRQPRPASMKPRHIREWPYAEPRRLQAIAVNPRDVRMSRSRRARPRRGCRVPRVSRSRRTHHRTPGRDAPMPNRRTEGIPN